MPSIDFGGMKPCPQTVLILPTGFKQQENQNYFIVASIINLEQKRAHENIVFRSAVFLILSKVMKSFRAKNCETMSTSKWISAMDL